MSQGEFDIIKRYFQRQTQQSEGVNLGIGDDCAVVKVGGKTLVITTDTLVEGDHFSFSYFDFDYEE